MLNLKKDSSYILDSFQKALHWIKANSIGGGIAHSSALQKPYPEVTGYYIPSLLSWGEVELAHSYADWLLSIQTPEGAWQELNLQTIYTFDTGQILKGLFDLSSQDQKYEKAFLKGCDWLLSQIDSEGRIHTPEITQFASMGNEYIHLYALEPLKKAGEKYNRPDFLEAVTRALNYYLQKKDLTDFNILIHFHAYIVEALIDLGQHDRALSALKMMLKHQRSNGAIPAFPNVRWVCLVGMLQYAVCFYKLGKLEEGNTLLHYVIKKQQTSGGFYGGYGWFVKYFKNVEISWACKYLLDALHLRLTLEFAKEERAEAFLLNLDKSDGRYTLLKELVSSHSPKTFLDVGCGKGRFIHALISDGIAMHITALDISGKLFKYLPKECEKKIGNILSIPSQDNTYEFIFCCEVLEHAVNIEGAIRELHRVVKPNGVVLIIDKDLQRRNGLQLEAWEQWFDRENLKALMTSAGFATEVREIRFSNSRTFCAWIGQKLNA